jgi:hypothetical protein
MILSYTLTLADFKAARTLHRRQRFTRQIIHFIWPVLLVAFFIGAIISSGDPHSELFSQCFALGAASLVMSIGMPISRFFSVRRSFNRLFPPGQKNRTSNIDIDDERIVRELSETSELKLLWSAIYDFVENANVSLLYTNRDCFLIIPVRSMSPDQRTELKDLVARNMVSKQK